MLKFFDIKINKHLLIKFTSLLGLIAFAVFCVAVFSENLFREISESFTAQIRFLFGFDNYGRDYVFGLQLFTSLLGIFDKALDYPFILLIGDGFNASWGTPKGGDYGHAETLARFGIPFYCFIIIGFLKIMQVIIRNLRYLRKNREIKHCFFLHLWFLIYLLQNFTTQFGICVLFSRCFSFLWRC